MSTSRRSRATVSVAVALLASSVAACGATQSSSGRAAATAGTSAASPGTYASTSFVVPFDVTPPSWLAAQPQIEQSRFVTWEGTGQPAVRVMAPADLYRPGETTTSDVPSDYVSYLLGQAKNGGHFADQTTETVAGQPATVVTATTDTSLDGSLGCPTPSTAASDCFGLQPDLALRIAVLKVHDEVLLIWLRMDGKTLPTQGKEQVKRFEDMLATLRLSDRDPSPVTASASPAPATSPLDGNYRMSVSWPKVKTADARCVGGPEGTTRLGVYDLSLHHGHVGLTVRIGGPRAPAEDAFSGTFRATDHQFVFGDTAVPLTADYTVDGRALTLSNLQGGQCGDRAIWTTKPWIRQ